jgi:hypothetical protein
MLTRRTFLQTTAALARNRQNRPVAQHPGDGHGVHSAPIRRFRSA